MTTIINTPGETKDSGTGALLFFILALVIVGILVAMYGLPMLRNTTPESGTTINVPDSIKVDVDTGESAQ
ncbi:hypothetical protein K2P47_02790 [Patescibacteria group bacterium]|nr:hypothetical protein [Patescibacteria group bacterium]